VGSSRILQVVASTTYPTLELTLNFDLLIDYFQGVFRLWRLILCFCSYRLLGCNVNCLLDLRMRLNSLLFLFIQCILGFLVKREGVLFLLFLCFFRFIYFLLVRLLSSILMKTRAFCTIYRLKINSLFI
jgi:hypothetical protein